MRLLGTSLYVLLTLAACIAPTDLEKQAAAENVALLGYNIVDVGKYLFYAERTSPDTATAPST